MLILELYAWLNANKISLNASKTEFVIFRSKSRPLNSIPFLKLVGKKIYPSSSVKYLGVHFEAKRIIFAASTITHIDSMIQLL